jgi:hypothetical protein
MGTLLSPAAESVTVGGIVWTRRSVVAEGNVRVRTALAVLTPCRLRLTVNTLAPSEPKLQYLVSEGRDGFAARRLCVNTEHLPHPGTHKHFPRPGGGEEGSYEPDDIPDLPLQPRVAPGAYRAILEAFEAECFVAIGQDFIWVEP